MAIVSNVMSNHRLALCSFRRSCCSSAARSRGKLRLHRKVNFHRVCVRRSNGLGGRDVHARVNLVYGRKETVALARHCFDETWVLGIVLQTGT